MKNDIKILLITGPAGSGKTTLAEFASKKLGWTKISEDDFWVKHSWSGIRTDEQEATVQQEVINELLTIVDRNESVVLEFILYKKPPNPLSNYQDQLKKNGIRFKTVALKPSIESIKKRLIHRGRANDLENLNERLINAKNQIDLLDSDFIDSSWIMNSSEMTVEQIFEQIVD